MNLLSSLCVQVQKSEKNTKFAEESAVKLISPHATKKLSDVTVISSWVFVATLYGHFMMTNLSLVLSLPVERSTNRGI